MYDKPFSYLDIKADLAYYEAVDKIKKELLSHGSKYILTYVRRVDNILSQKKFFERNLFMYSPRGFKYDMAKELSRTLEDRLQP